MSLSVCEKHDIGGHTPSDIESRIERIEELIEFWETDIEEATEKIEDAIKELKMLKKRRVSAASKKKQKA